MSLVRSYIRDARRIVVKVGSSSLTCPQGGLNPDALDALVDTIAAASARGASVVLVSSGAVAAGMTPLGLKTRPRDLSTQQASASVGQMLLVSRYASSFARHRVTVSQVLLTADDVIRRSHYRNVLRTFDRLLELGVVPIVNENDTVATEEIQFGDNDRLAALTAHLLRAEALVLLSDVDGVYTAHPSDPDAELLASVPYGDGLASINTDQHGSSVGTGGMGSKLEAARISASAGVHTVVTSTAHAHAALAGESVGTYFAPADTRPPARTLWLRHAARSRGTLTIDDGAVHALRHRGASLLAPGVHNVAGRFASGDAVDVCAHGGEIVARGLSSFDAEELPTLLASTHQRLGREIVHRDDMVLV